MSIKYNKKSRKNVDTEDYSLRTHRHKSGTFYDIFIYFKEFVFLEVFLTLYFFTIDQNF